MALRAASTSEAESESPSERQPVLVAHLAVRSALVDRVVEALRQDQLTQGLVGKPGFAQGQDGSIRFQGRLCVPEIQDFRQDMIAEAHRSRFSIRDEDVQRFEEALLVVGIEEGCD